MNVYFACSITGGRQDEEAYRAIVEALLAGGHNVPTSSLSRPDVLALEAIVEPTAVYKRDIAWIDACQALVAEVSTPSHGVGFEIAYALCREKYVLCCYRQGKTVSKMITGNTHPKIRVRSYESLPELVRVVQAFLAEVTNLHHEAS